MFYGWQSGLPVSLESHGCSSFVFPYDVLELYQPQVFSRPGLANAAEAASDVTPIHSPHDLWWTPMCHSNDRTRQALAPHSRVAPSSTLLQEQLNFKPSFTQEHHLPPLGDHLQPQGGEEGKDVVFRTGQVCRDHLPKPTELQLSSYSFSLPQSCRKLNFSTPPTGGNTRRQQGAISPPASLVKHKLIYKPKWNTGCRWA